METKIQTQWYGMGVKEVFGVLESSADGLSTEEAAARLSHYGENKLAEAKTDSYLTLFLRQFTSPLVYILVGAALLVLSMGEIIDGITILVVLLLNAFIGLLQEGKAQNTLKALTEMARTEATVKREGRSEILPDTQLVPGDIIALKEGEKVPADARLLQSSHLVVNESALTGESIAVYKQIEAIESKTLLGLHEQKNMVFKGTHVLSGSGEAIITATGGTTIIGKISRQIAGLRHEIPLERNMRYLAHLIVIIVGIVSVALFILGVLRDEAPRDMFSLVVSLAVSIVPEGLPIAITLVLATGVWRMSKRNALIKQLQAVEALSGTHILAVDKTGTITKNELTVKKLWIGGKEYEVTGDGYDAEGSIVADGAEQSVSDSPSLAKAGVHIGLCAHATISFDTKTKQWSVSGDPTDAALLVLAEKLGAKKEALLTEHQLIEELPFDYKKKYHVTLHQAKRQLILSVLGAPESLAQLSTLTKPEHARIIKASESWARSGFRVIAFASKTGSDITLEGDELPKLEFGGLIAMADTLQERVTEAVDSLASSGIKTVMITGDNKITATSIAEQAHIFREGDGVITGAELAELSPRKQRESMEHATVFARVTPEDKMRIVTAYQASGHTIAMTGDGVNDAPSLSAADLGIAMGVRGTEVAKEAADIVLLDDNFQSIVAAVEEGRNIYKTIKKVIAYLFSTSLGELLVITGALLLSLPVPLLPVQIIWLNFVTDGFLTLALGFEPKESGLLRGKFKKPNKYLVDGTMLIQMILMGGTMTLGTLYLFHAYGAQSIKATTIALTALAVFQWFNAWNVRSERVSLLTMNPFSNPALIIATALVILFHIAALHVPFLQHVLHTTPLTWAEWKDVLVISLSIIAVEEVRKLVVRLKNKE